MKDTKNNPAKRNTQPKTANQQNTKNTTGKNPQKQKATYKLPENVKISHTQWLLVVGALIITFIAYFPALKNDLTNWDDKSYVTENPLLTKFSGENIKAMFASDEYKYYMGNYHPLSILSLAIDYQIGTSKAVKQIGNSLRDEKPDQLREIEPFIFHFTNILMHLINTLLVFWLIFLLIRHFWVAFVAALLFGVNTLHVESVAWVSERKDVLHTLFFLLALISYIKYVDKNKLMYYGLAILLFVLAVLSKAQAVSLSVTLIAVDLLRNRQWKSPKVIGEKIPFLLLSFIFGIIAIKAQQQGEAIHDITEYPYYMRFVFASYGFTQYFVKMLAPNNLAAIYPYPILSAHGQLPITLYLYLLPAIGSIMLFFHWLRTNKQMAFGLAFFIINIFLVLQFLPVGSAIMADRYSYIPSIGFFLILGLGVKWILEKKDNLKPLIFGGLGLYTLVMCYFTFSQSQIWKNSITLWEKTVKISPKAIVAWNNYGSAKDALGTEKEKEGNTEARNSLKEEAIFCFTQAIALKPDYYHAVYNRGTAKKDLNRFKEAVDDFNEAIRVNPNFGEAFHNRGISRESLGDVKGALADYNRGIEILPRLANLYSSRGVAKGKLNDFESAIADFNISIQLKPNNPEAYSNRGLANDFRQDYQAALRDYDMALSLNPKFSTAKINRGIVKRKLKQYDNALIDFNEALQFEPNSIQVLTNRYQVYAETNRPNLACADLQMLKKMGVKGYEGEIAKYCK